MKKTLDIIVRTPFAPNKPHADMIALGYKFVCSHMTIEAFTESDTELDIDSHEVFAVQQAEGVNFYVKESKP